MCAVKKTTRKSTGKQTTRSKVSTGKQTTRSKVSTGKQLPVVKGQVRTKSGTWKRANQRATCARKTRYGTYRGQSAVRRGKVRTRAGKSRTATQRQSYAKH